MSGVMGDLRSIEGGKKQKLGELNHVICGNCDNGLFSWRRESETEKTYLACAVCSTLFDPDDFRALELDE